MPTAPAGRRRPAGGQCREYARGATGRRGSAGQRDHTRHRHHRRPRVALALAAVAQRGVRRAWAGLRLRAPAGARGGRGRRGPGPGGPRLPRRQRHDPAQGARSCPIWTRSPRTRAWPRPSIPSRWRATVLRGYNTDVEGVRGALVAAAGDGLGGEPALILGAGGAARAAALALARLGCALTIVNRTPAAAERLAALMTAGVPGARCGWLALSDLTAGDVRRQRVVVNATSLGMAGEGKVPALLADNVTAGQVVFDAVYAAGAYRLPRDGAGGRSHRRRWLDDAAGAGGRGVQPLDRRAGAAGSDARCRPTMTGRPVYRHPDR